MKFGIFYEISVPRPWDNETEHRVYHNCIEQAVLADKLGFDHVWAVEHHFLEEYSHCSAPEIFLTAIAARTERIRVGHGINVCVPQMNPAIRIAERSAVLDIVSSGRLDVGTGRSATWTELGGFGANPDTTKATWDEFVADAKALTKRSGSRLTQEGYGFAPNGQGHNLLREVLIRQYGGQPYSADGTKVAYNDEAGLKAFEFYTGLVTTDKVAELNFVPGDNGYRDGFGQIGNIAMIVDGSFAIGSVKAAAQFDWGVAELPTLANGVRSDFGSFWMNGLTPNAFKDPARLEAASKFLQFVTSESAMKLWLNVVGELPARASLVADPTLSSDPVYGPFIKSLAYSHATQFVDETAQRQVFMDAVNRVILQNQDPAASWAQAAKEEQAVLDKAHGM